MLCKHSIYLQVNLTNHSIVLYMFFIIMIAEIYISFWTNKYLLLSSQFFAFSFTLVAFSCVIEYSSLNEPTNYFDSRHRTKF